MPRQVTFIESFIKYTASIIVSTIAVITFLTPRTIHNALATEVKANKDDIKINQTDTKIILALVCKLSVKSLGKDAVDDYCITTTRGN